MQVDNPGDVEDLSLSVAERRTRRLDRQLPLRYRDVLPEILPPLPPPGCSLLIPFDFLLK